MNGFHGANKRHSYFEGWYLKHQNGVDTVAFIPAYHISRDGERSASVQIVTGESSHYLCFAPEEFSARSDRFYVGIGGSRFSQEGLEVKLTAEGLNLEGELRYGPFAPARPDIMGPFRCVPFMQCRHGVLSLYHRVDGVLYVNGRRLAFQDGAGYMETDRGVSFPRAYLWTQCLWHTDKPCSVMLSIAEIPFMGGTFRGCICSVLFGGREYRLATYRGAKIESFTEHSARVKQGDMTLWAELTGSREHSLRAPERGGMTRTVHESPACTVLYRFSVGKSVLFDTESKCASFEYSENTPDG